MVADGHVIYFCSTQGGGPPEPGDSDTVQGWGNGFGQIWAYHTKAQRLDLVYQSPGPDTLDFPDNVTTRGRNTLVLCEDSTGDNFLRTLTSSGKLGDLALNRLTQPTGRAALQRRVRRGRRSARMARRCSSTSRPAAGMTFAIWGPWAKNGV